MNDTNQQKPLGTRADWSGQPRLVSAATGTLAEFNEAGILDAGDVHVATALGSAVGEKDPLVLLAVALTVAQVRAGSVCLNLADIREVLAADQPDVVQVVDALPTADAWRQRIAQSPLIGAENPPVALIGDTLYLDRYLRHEQRLAVQVISRQQTVPPVDVSVRERDLERLLAEDADPQQERAIATAVDRAYTLIAGGPGTGKTTTIGKIAAALLSQLTADPAAHPMIAFAAPTGRAAARLQEAIWLQASELDVTESVRDLLRSSEAVTLHRLLGWQPLDRSRFVHDANNPLPHDVVIVDECSMISLALMDQLFDAVRTDARVVLVGDPQQLASVDAGSVFGDLVGTVDRYDEEAGVVVLERSRRFGDEISGLAGAVLAGDSDGVIDLLRADDPILEWYETSDRGFGAQLDARLALLSGLESSWVQMLNDSAAGNPERAADTVHAARILCAHRDGSAGVRAWNRWAFDYLVSKQHLINHGIGLDPNAWFVGRPIMVTKNDYGVGLYNGDTGVVALDSEQRTVATFHRDHQSLTVQPGRLPQVVTAFATTVHKSQGSGFGTVAVVLPGPDSPVLTRELLYTAITRARHKVVVLGSRESLVAAIARRTRRASGLAHRVWPDTSPSG